MLKIRLMRIGAKKRPFYRVVAVDERAKRNGAYLELLGTYNPLTTPHEINLKKDRIEHWLKQGAVKSDGFLRILGEAPQRPPRKAKKQKQESESQKSQEEPKVEEKPVEETAQANTSDGGSVSEAKADSSEVSAVETVAENEIATAMPDGGPRNDKEKEEPKNEGSA